MCITIHSSFLYSSTVMVHFVPYAVFLKSANFKVIFTMSRIGRRKSLASIRSSS